MYLGGEDRPAGGVAGPASGVPMDGGEPMGGGELASGDRPAPLLSVDGTDVPLRLALNMADGGGVSQARPSDGELFAQARAGDERAREQLVERYLPLARRLARRYQRSEEPLEDLTQVASLGLLKAVDRYDTGRDTAFSSFAVPTILGELRRHFRDRTWSVRVPRELQELALRVDRTASALSSEHGRAPTVGEIAVAMDVSEEQVLEALQAAGAYRAGSLDAPRSGAGEDATGESVADAIGVRGGWVRARGGARDAGADVRPHHRARAAGADAALRRGPDPGRDRRADRRLADAGLAADPPGARAAAGGSGRGPAAQPLARAAPGPRRPRLSPVADLWLSGLVAGRDAHGLTSAGRRRTLWRCPDRCGWARSTSAS